MDVGEQGAIGSVGDIDEARRCNRDTGGWRREVFQIVPGEPTFLEVYCLWYRERTFPTAAII